MVRLVEEEVEILRRGRLNLKLLAEAKTKTVFQTHQFAQKTYPQYFQKELAQKAVLLILKGELGAGKTAFAQGIGQLFGQKLTSPTFVLLDEYLINQPPLKNLYHLFTAIFKA